MSGTFPRPFGKYVLIKPLEGGGTGQLYLAVGGETGGFERLCVVRTLGPKEASEEAFNRFLSDAKVAVKLSHSNLVQVLDAGKSGDVRYLVMEHVEGVSLRELLTTCLSRKRPLPPAAALYIALQVCRGLNYAHTYGDHPLVHRELCPSKVFASFFGEVKVSELGVAYSGLSSTAKAPPLSFGRLGYLAPEQANGAAVNGRADVYAVGLMLWEMLVGQPLRQPVGDIATARAAARETTVVPPSTRNGKLPPQLDPLVVKALQPRPAHRHRSAEALRNALATAMAQVDPTFDASTLSEVMRKLFRKQIERARIDRERILSQSYDHLRRSTGPGFDSGQPPLNEVNLSGELIAERYRAIKQIGEGGMGAVYEAEHLEIGRIVAIKILHAAYSRDPEAVARFREEARAATKIGHPNIVEVTDSGTTHGGRFFFVMEMLAGVDLAQVMAETRIIDRRRSLDITLQICAALHAAHEQGIIHRDLKPENIFLTERAGRRDFVKILDFGIAKNLDLAKDGEARLTTPGIAMGTPEYMAPEQAAGEDVDRRIDVYATGAMLYEMLTGHLPHEAQNLMQLLSKKAQEPPVPPSHYRPDVPRALEAAILRALESDRAQRFQTMEELAAALELMDGGVSTTTPSGGIGYDPTLEIGAVKVPPLDVDSGSARIDVLDAAAASTPRRTPSEPAYLVNDGDVQMSDGVMTLEQQTFQVEGANPAVGTDPTVPLSAVHDAMAPARRVNWPAWLLGSILAGLVAGGLIWWRAIANNGHNGTTTRADARVVKPDTAPPKPDASVKPDSKPKKPKHRKMTPQEVDRMLEWAKRAAAGKRWFRPRSDNVRFLLKRIERDYPQHPKLADFRKKVVGKHFLRLVRKHRRRRRYVKAERVYVKWVRLAPDADAPRWGLYGLRMRDAYRQLRRRRYKSAMRMCREATRWQPKAYKALLVLGDIAMRRRLYRTAYKAYKEALERPKLSRRTKRRLQRRLRRAKLKGRIK